MDPVRRHPAPVTVTGPGDLIGVVPRILGFEPEDSLVFVGLGSGAPTARIDMPGTVDDLPALRDALAPAARHWSPAGVVVVGFTERPFVFRRLDWSDLLPGVEVREALLASDFEPTQPEGADVLPEPATCREALATEAEKYEDPEAALSASWDAYRAGDGARAWVFHDRAIALGGAPDRELVARLVGAVSPNDGGGAA